MAEPVQIAGAAADLVARAQALAAAAPPDEPEQTPAQARVLSWRDKVEAAGAGELAGRPLTDWSPMTRRAVEAFLAQADRAPSTRLLLRGPTGTGKTSLALTIAAMLVERRAGSAVYAEHNVWLEQALSYGDTSRDRRHAVDELKAARVLVLDDFGVSRARADQAGHVQRVSAAAERVTTEVLGVRAHGGQGRVTLVTGNLTQADVEAQWGDRVASRLFHDVVEIGLTGADRRRAGTPL